MKVVSYGKGNAHIITDQMFEAAAESWQNNRPVFIRELNLVLPAPKTPAGTPQEHEGLQIGFSWDQHGLEVPFLPGWVAVRKPTRTAAGKEVRRGAVYTRNRDASGEKAFYYWAEINVRDPSNLSRVASDITSDEVKEFIDRIDFTPVDELLGTPSKRGSVPLEMLLPAYLL